MEKLGSQMDAEVLRRLREHAAKTGQTLAWLLTQSTKEYLDRQQLRPAFVEEADAVLDEHAELLDRLAR
jgi:predicted transcriptional regulator